MTHFSLGEWACYVRGLATDDQKTTMRKHLQKCSSCRKTVGIWTSISEFGKHEAAYEPPASALRVVESYLAPFQLACRRPQLLQLAKATFDSFARQAPAGVRGVDLAPQQLMYECGNAFIDLRLEPRPATRSIVVAGQIVSSGEAESGLPGIQVSLLQGEDGAVETATNEAGEFHFSYPVTQRARLLFGMPDAAWLVLLPAVDASSA